MQTVAPRPIALCVEKLDGELVRCTAVQGRENGLAIGVVGTLLWRSSEPAACTIWVSRDERLMAERAPFAPRTTLVRSGRSLELPEGKPVVLRNQDELLLDGVDRFRVHLHGYARTVEPPTLLRRAVRATAVGLALAALGCGSENGIRTGSSASSTPASADASSSYPDADTDVQAAPDAAPADPDAGIGVDPYPFDLDGGDEIDVRDFPPR
jgi:hypothetical protein